jgi:hypothetical protein
MIFVPLIPATVLWLFSKIDFNAPTELPLGVEVVTVFLTGSLVALIVSFLSYDD